MNVHHMFSKYLDTIGSRIQGGICMQTILMRKPLIFVFQGPNGNIWVPARKFPETDIFFIGHFKKNSKFFYIRYTNFQTTCMSICLLHINGCRMTEDSEKLQLYYFLI